MTTAHDRVGQERPGPETDLTALLMTRAMTDPELRRASSAAPSTPILPDVTVLKVGGPDAGLDPLVLELLATAKHLRQVRVVNGLVGGELTAALGGADVGAVLPA